MSLRSATERVRWTLLGFADGAGRIEGFSKTEALDYAETVEGEFERSLRDLIESGAVIELERLGRARRFQMRDLADRLLGRRYHARRRDHVLAIANLRARLEPGRATLIGVSLPQPIVVRAAPLPDGPRGRRWDLTVIIPGLGTVQECVYTADAGTGFVLPPSVWRDGRWVRIIDWTADFARAVRDAAQTYLAESGEGSNSDSSAIRTDAGRTR